jgi:putative hydrolase of the HAD superfamily
MIKGVTFDCWDTILVDDESNNREIKENLIKVMGEHGRTISKKKMDQLFMEEEEDYRIHVVSEKKTRDSHARTLAIIKLAKIDLPERVIDEIADYSDRTALNSPPPAVSGIKDALEELSRRFKLAVICNTGWHSGEVVRELLHDYGLTKYFQYLSFSDEVGLAKPHRHMFEYTLDRMDINPEEAVHIGDSEYSDIVGASNAGMKTILYAGINKSYENDNSADITIRDYNKLAEIIKKL